MVDFRGNDLGEFTIGQVRVGRGERRVINLGIARLYDFTEMKIPVKVIRGKEDGPTLFVCAAIHGDELNGVEIVRRLLAHKSLQRLKGTLIAVPIVNIFGFNARSRYLPDRRDLNRSFPGTDRGSLASRLAYIFMEEIVKKSTHGIDLHTGSGHRTNLPQIRACLDEDGGQTRELASAFGAPVVLNSNLRDGSLRQAASDLKIPLLLYEGGEALRFDKGVIQLGVRGILNVMRAIGMLSEAPADVTTKEPFIANTSHWLRAPQSGILRRLKRLGSFVQKGDLLAVISNPFGEHKVQVRSFRSGFIIGATFLPLVNKGDALFHIATLDEQVSMEESHGLAIADLAETEAVDVYY